jgi:hypothetical protein
MKLSVTMILWLLACANAWADQKQPTDAELSDWMNYLRSIGIPSTVKICGPVLQDEARLKSASQAWFLHNQASVDRGYALAASHPPKGSKSLEDYNAAMVRDFETRLGSKPAPEKLKVCTDYLALLEKRAQHP